MMAHVGLSVAFGNEALQLADDEGDKLAAAVQKVARHYDMPDIASETKDWIGLIICAGTIYGTRIAAHVAEKNAPPPARPAQENDNRVTSITSGRVPGSFNHPGQVQ